MNGCSTCSNKHLGFCEVAIKPLDRARYLEGWDIECFLTPAQWNNKKEMKKTKGMIKIQEIKDFLKKIND